MTTHELKTHPAPFQAVLDGTKRFEFRRDDREPRFEVGDVLRLREWTGIAEWAGNPYTGRELLVRVTYLLRGPAFGIPTGFVGMSIVTEYEREPEPSRFWRGEEV